MSEVSNFSGQNEVAEALRAAIEILVTSEMPEDTQEFEQPSARENVDSDQLKKTTSSDSLPFQA